MAQNSKINFVQKRTKYWLVVFASVCLSVIFLQTWALYVYVEENLFDNAEYLKSGHAGSPPLSAAELDFKELVPEPFEDIPNLQILNDMSQAFVIREPKFHINLTEGTGLDDFYYLTESKRPQSLDSMRVSPTDALGAAKNFVEKINAQREQHPWISEMSSPINSFDPEHRDFSEMHSIMSESTYLPILDKRLAAIRVFVKHPLFVGIVVPLSVDPMPFMERLDASITIHERRYVKVVLALEDTEAIAKLKGTYESWIQMSGLRIMDRSGFRGAKPFHSLMTIAAESDCYFISLDVDLFVAENFVTEIGWWLSTVSNEDFSAAAFYADEAMSDKSKIPLQKFDGRYRGVLIEPVMLKNVTTALQVAPTESLTDILGHLHNAPSILVHYPYLFAQSSMDLVQIKDYIGAATSGSYSIPEDMAEDLVYGFLKNHRIVFGIPSVYRNGRNYLPRTVFELLSKVPAHFLPYVTFVVLNCNVPASENLDVLELKESFGGAIARGNLVILEYTEKHPQLLKPLRQTWNDTMTRVQWRSKQSLDFAYLMDFSMHLGDYYVQLEDDIILASNYLAKMVWWLEHYYSKRADWLLLSFYHSNSFKHHQYYDVSMFFGFIGQLFRSSDLPPIVDYFRQKFDYSPVDWLMKDYLLEVAKGRKIYIHVPNLFQHVGMQSSLDGKIQKIRSMSFDDREDTLIKGTRPFLLSKADDKPEFNSLADSGFFDTQSIVICISTVPRPQRYLRVTLKLLLQSLSPRELDFVKIKILDASGPDGINEDLTYIRYKYSTLIQEGKLEILSLPENHKELKDAQFLHRLGRKEEMMWQAKIVLDHAYLLETCADQAHHLLFLEDDVTMHGNFFSAVALFLKQQLDAKERWIALRFYGTSPDNSWPSSGLLGYLIPSDQAKPLAKYLQSRFQEKEIGPLLDAYNHGWSLSLTGTKVICYDHPLFEDIGRYRSLWQDGMQVVK